MRADRRRRGRGAAMMAELERIVRSGYQLGRARGQRRRRPALHVAGLAAVARAGRSAHPGRNPAHPGPGRRHLRTAGSHPG
ncbi:MAG: hypothetical protein ACLPKI_00665 [Streptosporangiaceae bacterium]